MYYSNIKDVDIADGIGVRVSLFVSGCTNRCKNCFNPETWNFKYGEKFTKEVENYVFKLVDKKYIDGISILGGDPMEPSNQYSVLNFLIDFHKYFKDTKSVWVYSGFTFEKLIENGNYCHTTITEELLHHIDILVDGKFIEELKNPALVFRGSSNQRIIDVKKTFEQNKIVIAPFKDRIYSN